MKDFNEDSKKNAVYYFLTLLLCLLALVYQTSPSYAVVGENETDALIGLNLEYRHGTPYDTDNDGIENLTGTIDFTAENTKFRYSPNLDWEKLCTRWNVYSVESEQSTTICYGDENCCNFVSLIPARSSWKEPFYLTYGLYSTSYDNIVSAQVMHVDYNITSENPYSEIYYSDWGNLPAVFEKKSALPFSISNAKYLSSLELSFENSTINISIKSPDNSTSLPSGESVQFNFTSNVTINVSYSFKDNYFSMGNGTSFSAILNGTMPYGIIGNGISNMLIFIEDLLGNNATIGHVFTINDAMAPSIFLNLSNNSAISATYPLLPLSIASNEHANIKYKANGGSFSDLLDLGQDNKIAVNITLAEGKNNLTINITDYHLNEEIYYFTFNFTETGTCSDAKKNGIEEGIDCGGSCTSCIDFNMNLSKNSYNLTDDVYVTVISRTNSTVNLTVLKDGQVSFRHNFIPVFLGAPIAEIRKIENTSNAGNYSVRASMHYLAIAEDKNLTFEMLAPESNPLSVTINANATSIIEGDPILFSAIISGNSGTIAYRWDFENDGTIDSNEASPIKVYGGNGTYIVNLTVFDNLQNQTDTETIMSRNMFNITFLISDNLTKSPIEQSEIRIDEEIKNTSADGRAVFTLVEDDYTARVGKPGYNTIFERFVADKNEEFAINLTRQDNDAPKVSLLKPENEATISNTTIEFVYTAQDQSDMTCMLHIADAPTDLFIIRGTDFNVQPSGEKYFTVNLENGTYKIKVECIDREGNSNSSEINTFTIDVNAPSNELSVDLDEQDKSAADIVTGISQAIGSLDQLATKEKSAAEAMQLRKIMDRAILEIERANRDLHSLKWRKLNETELGEETQKILDRIENVRLTTPKSLIVEDSTEFVKYPSKDDVQEATLLLLNQTNLKLSKRDLRRVVEENQKLQSLISVTTNARIISLEYLSGNTEKITLVQKTIGLDGNLSNVKFYEIIPKDIASDINQTEIFFEYELIERDPVIEIDIIKIRDYSYYIRKEVSLKDIEKTQSILLSKDAKSKKKNIITGFAIIDDFASNLIETTDIRLLVEIILIVILAAIYLVYSFGGFETLIVSNSKDVKEIHSLISSALVDLKGSNYENASQKYKEINSKFNKLEKRKKNAVKNSVVELLNKINLLYVDNLVREANESLKSDDKQKANMVYSKMQAVYKIMPKDYKKEVSEKCLMVHSSITSKAKQ